MTSNEGACAIAAFQALYPKLFAVAKTIEQFEGANFGSRAWRNNNPGNLRASPFATGSDVGVQGTYCIFNHYFVGFYALLYDLHSKVRGKTSTGLNPNSQLHELMRVYAPPTENDPEAYLKFVSDKTGISATTCLKDLL